MLRIHRGIGPEVIETARGSPSPGAQRAPIIRLAGLSLIDQSDDALGQPRSVIGLNAGGIDECVSPAIGDQLFGRQRVAAGDPRRTAAGGLCARHPPEKGGVAEHHHDGNGSSRIGRRHQCHLNIHIEQRIRRIVHMPHQLLLEYATRATRRHCRAGNCPRHSRYDSGDTTIYFRLEVLDDLRTALLPPDGGLGHFLAVLQPQDVGQIREGIGQGLVVVGMIGRLFVTAGPRTERLDAELLHHVLMIFDRRPVLRLRQVGCVGGRGRGGRRRRLLTGSRAETDRQKPEGQVIRSATKPALFHVWPSNK